MIKKRLAELKDDSFLQNFIPVLEQRHADYLATKKRLTSGKQKSLSSFAMAHYYYGLHKNWRNWTFREWAPNAEEIFLVGDFSNWQLNEDFKLKKINSHGDWELKIPVKKISHGMHYKLVIKFGGTYHDRLPVYANYVCQDKDTLKFTARVWEPQKKYTFKYDKLASKDENILIYECHIGMSGEEEKISSFNEFRENVLPRIAKANYNTIQIMALMSHPYYGSFGYHVANFFSISSNFGTPEELKMLIDEAHKLGLRVIIDLVHSHAVKNEVEGIAKFDGTKYQYFHEGARGEHSAWDSLCFNYGKDEVLHFLLSNCRYYLEEYHVDGFRFDGVTSMLYHHHGLNKVFTSYYDYFSEDVDKEAITYLSLANDLIHEFKPSAITVAEDVSGMIGLAVPVQKGGIGFDYRMAMGVTDMWFKLFDLPDEDWNMFYLYHELTNRRQDEKTISYVECHDQAIVGGQTAIFRLIGSDMYTAMSKLFSNFNVGRGLALHKMVRLATFSCCNSGYLNFMGNEFGHPEWIDFPREGNNWSYKYARRQWSLTEDPNLYYGDLQKFDSAMIKLNKEYNFLDYRINLLKILDADKVIAFERGNLWFFFNFNPHSAMIDKEFDCLKGEYDLLLSTDFSDFGGHDQITFPQRYYTQEFIRGNQASNILKLYIPARCAVVLRRVTNEK
jgi:1,4-alpha-glucan branching enzyme